MQLPQGLPPDSVRAVLRDIFAARSYDWTARPDPWAWIRAAWHELVAFFDRMSDQHPVGYWALMAVLVLIVILIFMHIGSALKRALRPAPLTSAGPDPLPAARDAAWHLAEARRLAGEALFPEALGHRFMALILELESRRAVAVRPSKTPAEYAREVRLDATGRGIFADLVTALYAAAFGGRVCDAVGFATFDRTATELARHASPAR